MFLTFVTFYAVNVCDFSCFVFKIDKTRHFQVEIQQTLCKISLQPQIIVHCNENIKYSARSERSFLHEHYRKHFYYYYLNEI